MRVATASLFDQRVATLHRQQSAFARVGEQLASGRRVLNPSDDPLAASRSVALTQAKDAGEQYAGVRTDVRNRLSREEVALDAVNSLVISARTLLVQAGSDVLNDTDRNSIALQLRGLYDEAIALGNTYDASQRYLFGGFENGKPPFERDGSGHVVYVGDTNTIDQRVDEGVTMRGVDPGVEVFRLMREDGSEGTLFTTLETALAALETPTTTAADKDAVRSAVLGAQNELMSSHDNVLAVRASVGVRLNELEALDAIGAARGVHYAGHLSALVDLDYAAAISDYSLQQTALSAAQKTIADASRMSLFNYL